MAPGRLNFYEVALAAELLRDWRAYNEGKTDRVLYEPRFKHARTSWLRKYQSERLRLEKYNRWVTRVND